MIFQPYRACTPVCHPADLSPMKPPVERVDSFTAADLPDLPPPNSPPPPAPTPAPKRVRAGKAVKHLPMMKALASRPRLAVIELCLDGSSFTATDLQTPMRLTARRVADHLNILCKLGVLSRRPGADKRETEYFINPQFVRKADDGTAIFDFGSGQLYFPRVRLG